MKNSHGGMDFGEFDEDGTYVTYEKETLQGAAYEIYLNRVAFGYIAAGYILAIFGNLGEANRFLIGVCVVALSVILLCVGRKICDIFSKKKFTHSIRVKDD